MTREKSALRRELLARRSELGSAARAAASARAATSLASSPFFLRARTIALYAPMRDEADPTSLEGTARRLGARVAYPRVEGSSLVFAAARLADLESAGALGILEPTAASPRLSVGEIDLFVVPGVGFSLRGDRIGYGRGFYDRTLREARKGRIPSPIAVGFAFACQVLDSLPSSPSDERVDFIATEDGLLLVAAP